MKKAASIVKRENTRVAKTIGIKKDFSGSLRLCFVGRFSTNKGLIKLISALKKIKISN